jgi:TetR/AcrR family fatty acid metabolism transcriptional regulator
VIGYHFEGKDELIAEVVAEVLARAEEYMLPRISAESSGSAMLRAYIESNLAFMGAYRNHLIAIAEIARNARREDGSRSFDPTVVRAGAAALAQLLAKHQRTGEFRDDFDPAVVAIAIRAAIDAIPPRLASEPDFDVEHYGHELADVFELATRNPTRRRRRS